MMKHAPEWVRTSNPVIRSPAHYRWTTAPAYILCLNIACDCVCIIYIYLYMNIFVKSMNFPVTRGRPVIRGHFLITVSYIPHVKEPVTKGHL